MLASTSTDLTTVLGGSALIIGLIGLACVIFTIWVWWRILAKAGYSGALSLLMFIPIAGLILLLVLAFSEWPIQKELNMRRNQVPMQAAQYPPQGSFPSNPQYPPQGPFPSNPQYPQYRQ